MAVRTLAVKLSEPGDLPRSSLEPWQLAARARVAEMFSVAFQERLLLTTKICQSPKPNKDTVVQKLTVTIEKVCQLSCIEAEQMARMALAARSGQGATATDGIQNVSPFAWSLEEISLWKSPPDNKKLCRLVRSMLGSGYDRGEPIQSRSNDLSDWDGSGLLLGRLLFGDGQSRGLAVLMAWKVMMEWIDDSKFLTSPGLERVFRTLLQIPAVFEARRQSQSIEHNLLECAVKQNIKAHMIQPLNTMDWIYLFLSQHPNKDKESLLTWASPNVRKSNGMELLAIKDRFLGAYEEHSEVKAYDMAPPAAKRPRASRSKARATGGATENAKEDTVSLGAMKKAAMKNILTKISPAGLKRWQEHLSWVGVWKFSAMQDAAAATESLWPDSLPPKDRRPTELEDQAREMGSKVGGLAPGQDQVLSRAPLFYNERLTSEQHNMMLFKGFESYESATLHIENLSEKVDLRPSTEKWQDYRQVVEHWDRTIRQVALKDMSPEGFRELEDSVLNTTLMDQQILDAVRGYPMTFHLAMIPDLKAYYAEELDEEAQQMVDSHERYWQAFIDKFKLELQHDQKKIRRTKTGSAALKDVLDWLDLKSKIALQAEAGRLAKLYAEWFFPLLASETWGQLPGAFAVAKNQVIPSSQDVPVRGATARQLVIIKADFNAPNARDSMKMLPLCGAMATIVRQVGAQNVVVVCYLATRAKEDNVKNDALDHYMHLNSWKSCLLVAFLGGGLCWSKHHHLNLFIQRGREDGGGVVPGPLGKPRSLQDFFRKFQT